MKSPLNAANLLFLKDRFKPFVYSEHDSNEAMSAIFGQVLQYCVELLDAEKDEEDQVPALVV